MDKDELQEQIKDALEKYFSSGADISDIAAATDHLAELAIESIWDDIQSYMDDHEDILFDDE